MSEAHPDGYFISHVHLKRLREAYHSERYLQKEPLKRDWFNTLIQILLALSTVGLFYFAWLSSHNSDINHKLEEENKKLLEEIRKLHEPDSIKTPLP